MLALKTFRSKAAGLPDLLNYAVLRDEGIVQGKDGSVLAGFFYSGEDASVSTPAERNYITSMVNTYLSRLDAGWALWTDASRLPSPGYPAPQRSHFPDAISAMIDAERRAMFEQEDAHYETEHALIVQFLPPLRRESKVTELIYDDDGRALTEPGERLLAEFKRRLQDIEDGLSDLLHLRRMRTRRVAAPDGEEYDSDELVNYLHFCLHGEHLALRIPDCPMYLDAWLGMDSLWPGDTPKLGDQFIACVAIDGFPGHSVPGLLDFLDGLPLSYRWSTRYIFLDQHQAVAALKSYRRKWEQKVRGFWSQVIKSQKGMINTDALAMMRETEEAISEAQSGLVAYGYYTCVVVLMHRDRTVLEEQAREVQKVIKRRGFAARIETVNALEAWLGSLPGHTYPNVRRPPLHTLNLADFMPLSSVWPGLQENPCPFYPPGSPPLMHVVTTGETPFRLNAHVDDVGHILVFGPIGAGKSTFIAIVLVQARRYRSRRRADGTRLPISIIAFDKGRSLYTLCSAVGGLHYDIGADDSPLALAPLSMLDSDSAALWAEEWIAICFQLQAGKPLSPNQTEEVHRAITLMRRPNAAGSRSLTDFVTTVQDKEVRAALNHYTISGAMGHLLDGRSDALDVSSFTVFEIDELMKLGDANAIPVLLYLFRRFEDSLQGQPAILSLDEAWVVFRHALFREWLRKWLKELRKKNCMVMMATQSLSDAVNSGLLDVLLEQCPTKILLPNKEADLGGTEGKLGPLDFYRLFGLNDPEIHLLKTSERKRHYYYKSPLGRRLFELRLGPLALSFVAVSDKEALRDVKALEQTHGADWPLAWLQQRGVDYAQYVQ